KALIVIMAGANMIGAVITPRLIAKPSNPSSSRRRFRAQTRSLKSQALPGASLEAEAIRQLADFCACFGIGLAKEHCLAVIGVGRLDQGLAVAAGASDAEETEIDR